MAVSFIRSLPVEQRRRSVDLYLDALGGRPPRVVSSITQPARGSWSDFNKKVAVPFMRSLKLTSTYAWLVHLFYASIVASIYSSNRFELIR